jgi:hypothetical protein
MGLIAEVLDRGDRHRLAAALGDTISEDQIRSVHAASDRDLGPEPLALRGGTPVRSTMLLEKLPGPLYYDDDERRELLDGPEQPQSVPLVGQRSQRQATR